jgi:cytochrome c553
VLRIDNLDAKVVSLNQEIELVPPSCQFCGSVLERRDANLVPDAVVSPEGRLYLAHVQVKADPASTDVPGAYYGSDFSSGVSVPVVAEAVTTFDTETDTVVPQPNIASPVNQQGEVVPPALFVAEGQPMATPAAAALDPTGSWLFIANQNTDNVVVVSVRGRRSPTSVQGIFAQVKVGAGPKGIALSPDGRTAYVHNALDYTVSVLRASADGATLVVDRTAKFVESSPVPADVERGRRLFYSASNSRISNPNFGIACASCHPGGRDDGRTWDLPFQGLRNTPTLAGRHLRETKPYHWDGEFDEFSAFNKVIRERMGGTGALSRDFEDILTFLDSRWNPAPDNPHRTVDGGLTAAQARGRIVYEGKAGCGSCHSGAALTDNKSYSATRFTSRTGDTLMGGNVNTPSLRGLFATAPFLHDGTVGTLEARVAADRSGQHGTTSALTDGERADLVAYLKTL